jgi:Glycosyltransferase family 92
MSTDDWARFLEYAGFARAKQTFDAEDRDKPLAVADALRAMLEEAGRGGDWLAKSREAIRSARFSELEIPGRARWFNDWARADRDSLGEALSRFGASNRGAVDRFEHFSRAAVPAGPAGPALVTGSMLNFALESLELPVVRPGYYGRLQKLLGYEVPDTESVTEQYRRHLAFAASVRERLEDAGVEVRDMLDVQSLILSAARYMAFWEPVRSPDQVAGSSPSSYLALCAVYRDEAPYLREWIEFHRLMGVERFFLYDHRSSDDHLEVLAPYIESGAVVVHDWHRSEVISRASYDDQVAAYEHCVREHGASTRWLAVIDSDEFLFSPTGAPVSRILESFESYPGVAVNWALFGTSGHTERPPGLVTESYLERLEHPDEHWYKSIVDPRHVVGCDVHEFQFDGGLAVDENKYPASAGWTKSISRSLLRVNHYVTKSEAEFLKRRARQRTTGLPHYDLKRWNSVPTTRDEAILVHLDPLRTALARG